MSAAGAAVAALYIALLVGYGIVRGGKAKSFGEFTGNASEPPLWVISASMCAAFIGGGFSLGNAESGFAGGLSNTVLLLGFSLGQLVVGIFLAPRFAGLQGLTTVGGIVGRAYGEAARLLCGALSAVFCTGVLGAQINAIGSVAGYLFSLPPRLCAVIGFLVIMIYSTFGGLKSSLKSDTLQIIVLAAGLPLALGVALARAGGLSGLLAAAPAGHLDPLGGQTSLAASGAFLTYALGEMLCPPSVQRLLLSQNPRRTRGATLLSAGISVPFFAVTGFIGLAARVLGATDIAAYAMPSLVGAVLRFPLGALVCAAMLCVYLSSGGAFLNSCATALCTDVFGVLSKEKRGDAETLRLARAINVGCGALALGIALKGGNVLSILTLSYVFWAPVVLVPLVAALTGARYAPRSFFLPALAAAGTLLGYRAAGSPGGFSPLVIGFMANLIAFCLFKKKRKLRT